MSISVQNVSLTLGTIPAETGLFVASYLPVSGVQASETPHISRAIVTGNQSIDQKMHKNNKGGHYEYISLDLGIYRLIRHAP